MISNHGRTDAINEDLSVNQVNWDFVGIEKFGIRAIPPAAFLQEIGALP